MKKNVEEPKMLYVKCWHFVYFIVYGIEIYLFE